jgi:hypothetical protein
MPRDFSQRHANAVLFLTHFWDEACAAQVGRLRAELGDKYDICVIGYIGSGAAPEVPEDVPAMFYNEADFDPYPEFSDLTLRYSQIIGPRFFQEFPNYHHYWMIEYDVRYTGNWSDLFAELDAPAVDLYATVIQRRLENPDWYHWPLLRTGNDVLAEGDHVKIFTPVMRVSNTAFRTILAAYGRGWSGTYEVLWSTVVAWAGLKIEDIGAFGSFTPPARRGRHYICSALDPHLTPGSFVFRPSILEQEVAPDPPLLWHPVKPASRQASIPMKTPGWRDLPVLQPLRLWQMHTRRALRRRWRLMTRRTVGFIKPERDLRSP